MMRIFIGAALGASVLFVWGAVSWVFVPWHELETHPREEALLKSFTMGDVPTGVYTLPQMFPDPSWEPQQREIWMEKQTAKHEEGPLATIVYTAEGSPPMPVLRHVYGLGLYFVTALVAATLVAMAGGSLKGYFGRLLFVLLLGVFVAVGKTMIQWSYLRFPLVFSLEWAADDVVAALLLGLVLAPIVRPRGP